MPEIRAGQSGELTDVVSCNLRMLYKRLSDIDGLTTKETARLLGVPEGTVKAQVARARVKLARILQVDTTVYRFRSH